MALQLPAYLNPVEGFTTMGQTLNTLSLSMSAPKKYRATHLNAYIRKNCLKKLFQTKIYNVCYRLVSN